SIDGPNHVSATLSRAARVCQGRGPGNLPTRADPSLRPVSSAVSSGNVHHCLCGNMRDLLHRCDSVCRNRYTFANSSDAWRFLVAVPSAVRLRVRCWGRLHAAGISAVFDTLTAGSRGGSFIESTARTAATTVHLSAVVEIPTIKMSTNPV